MGPVFLVVAALFGLTVGSFLNVVIWRLPRGESLVLPGSHCPGCNTPIRWFDNIPVLSWLWLRGRCRGCKMRIAIRYPLVEMACGALCVLAAWRFGEHLATTAVVSAALAALLAISMIDWDLKIIPDRITKPGIVIAIALAPLTILHPEDWLGLDKPALNQWLHAAAGAAVGAVVILLIRFLGTLAFRKEAMGLGDVKLLALIGALVGPLQTLYALVLACVGGAVIGILRLLWARGKPLRFDLEVDGVGETATFGGARIDGEDLLVEAARPAPEGQSVKVRMVLPAAGILEDVDAPVKARGRIVEATPEGDRFLWRIHVEKMADVDRERVDMLAASLRYVPFGPFLALGGASTLLYGASVHWLITEGYPNFARGLIG